MPDQGQGQDQLPDRLPEIDDHQAAVDQLLDLPDHPIPMEQHASMTAEWILAKERLTAVLMEFKPGEHETLAGPLSIRMWKALAEEQMRHAAVLRCDLHNSLFQWRRHQDQIREQQQQAAGLVVPAHMRPKGLRG